MRKIVVATHGHCFDGMCSAVMFTRLYRHLNPAAELAFEYRGMGYGPGSNGVDPAVLSGEDNVILDFRFSTSPKLTWYFDHHVSAFPSAEDKATYEARAVGEGAARHMFHDGAYGSCTKLIADVGRERFGLGAEDPQVATLVKWADMIDSASFPSAQMAVDRAEPVLQLMTVVEHHGDDAFLAKMVPRLLAEDIDVVARDPAVQEAYAPLAAQNGAFAEMVKKHAKLVGDGRVVLVDLGDENFEVATKFVTYAMWPESAYSVVLSRSKTKVKISIGYNPWSNVRRTHDIARICERHGGGGHPVVGAISLPADALARARQIAESVSAELAT